MIPEAPWQPDWKTIDGNRFQDLCLDLLSCEGYELQDQGIGPDGGVDAILIQTLDLPDDTAKQIRWVAQFKFKLNQEATVKPHELGNVENILGRFQAEGFFLVTNGRVTNKALLELRGTLARRHPSYFVSVWTRRHLEQRLAARREVACRYFPLLDQKSRITATFEITIDLPFEDFSELQQRLFRHALASVLEVPVAAVTIREISKGSTKLVVEVPEETAQLLLDAFEGGYLTLGAFGFEPAILSVAEVNHPTSLEIIPPVRVSKSTETPALDRDQWFRDLYKRYYASVSAYLVRFGFPRDAARELAQETFLRAYRSMDQYRSDVAWYFLQRTARYLALNELRRGTAQMRSGAEISFEELPSLPSTLARDPWTGQVPASPEEDLADQEEAARRRKWLHHAIEELPKGIRTCLVLWLSGLKYSEIQVALNLSMDTVKLRLHEARRRLQERMAKEGEVIGLPEFPEDDDRDQQD